MSTMVPAEGTRAPGTPRVAPARPLYETPATDKKLAPVGSMSSAVRRVEASKAGRAGEDAQATPLAFSTTLLQDAEAACNDRNERTFAELTRFCELLTNAEASVKGLRMATDHLVSQTLLSSLEEPVPCSFDDHFDICDTTIPLGQGIDRDAVQGLKERYMSAVDGDVLASMQGWRLGYMTAQRTMNALKDRLDRVHDRAEKLSRAYEKLNPKVDKLEHNTHVEVQPSPASGTPAAQHALGRILCLGMGPAAEVESGAKSEPAGRAPSHVHRTPAPHLDAQGRRKLDALEKLDHTRQGKEAGLSAALGEFLSLEAEAHSVLNGLAHDATSLKALLVTVLDLERDLLTGVIEAMGERAVPMCVAVPPSTEEREAQKAALEHSGKALGGVLEPLRKAIPGLRHKAPKPPSEHASEPRTGSKEKVQVQMRRLSGEGASPETPRENLEGKLDEAGGSAESAPGVSMPVSRSPPAE
ncbi:unnamed protein product [Pedinophyceae sp. YPF-701]|nr:unnamed protein product [Pedinophyceae sp. YPF-701]